MEEIRIVQRVWKSPRIKSLVEWRRKEEESEDPKLVRTGKTVEKMTKSRFRNKKTTHREQECKQSWWIFQLTNRRKGWASWLKLEKDEKLN